MRASTHPRQLSPGPEDKGPWASPVCAWSTPRSSRIPSTPSCTELDPSEERPHVKGTTLLSDKDFPRSRPPAVTLGQPIAVPYTHAVPANISCIWYAQWVPVVGACEKGRAAELGLLTRSRNSHPTPRTSRTPHARTRPPRRLKPSCPAIWSICGGDAVGSAATVVFCAALFRE